MKVACFVGLLLIVNQLDAQLSDNCATTIEVGNASVCMPKVSGYVESFGNPHLWLKLGDQYDGITDAYSYYLNLDQAELIKKSQSFSLNDWFKVYMVTEMKNISISQEQFKGFSNLIADGYIRENWTTLSEKLEGSLGQIKISQPTMVKSYSTSKNSNTFVLLMPIKSKDEEKTIVMIMNDILLNDRILFVAYYLDYNGPKSLDLATQRNDYFIYRVLEENFLK